MESADVVIVGGRVAGASLALRLARAGRRVVVLEAESLYTDQPYSTHVMQPAGIAQLAEFGVLDGVLATTPYLRHASYQIDGSVSRMELASDQFCLCPKRSHLDPALQRAAIAAGADFREGAKVREVVREGDRVVGVRYDTRRGKAEIRADLIVGADGRRSTVAKLVGAAPYHEMQGPRATRFGYFERPSAYGSADWPEGFFVGYHGPNASFIANTSDGDVMMAIAAAPDRVQTGASDPLGWMADNLRSWESTAPLAEGLRPTRELRCLMKQHFFVRPASGPGWALIGDAGIHEDPSAGLGINHALRDAKALADAVLRDDERLLKLFWIERDLAVMSEWHFGNYLGALDYGHAFNRVIVEAVSQSERMTESFAEGIAAHVPPHEVFPMGPVLWTLVKELARGHWEAWPGFVRGFKVNLRIAAQLADSEKQRKKLLNEHPRLKPALRAVAALPA